MNIQIDPHTLQRANERGATEIEITDTLTAGTNILGKQGRLGKFKVFAFNKRGIINTMKKKSWKCIMLLKTTQSSPLPYMCFTENFKI